MAANARSEIATERAERRESTTGSENPLIDSQKKADNPKEQSAIENQNKKANEEYQSVAGLSLWLF